MLFWGLWKHARKCLMAQVQNGYEISTAGDTAARDLCVFRILHKIQAVVLVQREKPDRFRLLSYYGGELLALTFADFSCGFQL